jgi:hypothetical protein
LADFGVLSDVYNPLIIHKIIDFFVGVSSEIPNLASKSYLELYDHYLKLLIDFDYFQLVQECCVLCQGHLFETFNENLGEPFLDFIDEDDRQGGRIEYEKSFVSAQARVRAATKAAERARDADCKLETLSGRASGSYKERIKKKKKGN